MSKWPRDEDGDPPVEDRESLAERFNFPDQRGGILTDSDREYITGKVIGEEYEGQEPQKRLRIRKRVKSALHDFIYLSSPMMFPDEELNLVLDDIYKEDEPPRRGGGGRLRHGQYGEQVDHLLAAMRFLHRATEMTDGLEFEDLIEAAVWENTPRVRGRYPGGGGEEAREVNVTANIDVDIEWRKVYDADDIEAKLERGEQLTRDEIGELFVQGRIESGDLGAQDVDGSVFMTSGFQPEKPAELPGLDPPSAPSRSAMERANEFRDDVFTDQMNEKVDWDDVEEPRDVWDQLEEHYEFPLGYAMELEVQGERAEERVDELREGVLTDEMIETVDWDDVEEPRDVWVQLEEHYDDPLGHALERRAREQRDDSDDDDSP